MADLFVRVPGRSYGRSQILAPAPPTVENLQQAIDNAAPGSTIYLAPGSTYPGPFYLRAHGGAPITIRSSATLPNRRITPADAPLLPILTATNQGVFVASAVNDWILDGLNIQQTPGASYQEGIIIENSDRITLNRILLIGPDINNGLRRGIRANGRAITLNRSHIANCYKYSTDSQAYACWNGGGPHTLTDNYLEAASENVMFGGSTTDTEADIPSDILVENNLFSKRLEWQGASPAKVVKNIFELKCGRRVTVRNNIFERCWVEGQPGYGIVFTMRRGSHSSILNNQLEDVLFEHNLVRETVHGFNMLGVDDADGPSMRMNNITIRDNLIISEDRFMQIGGEMGTLTIDHNTIVNGSTFLTLYFGTIWLYGEPAARAALWSALDLHVTNNLFYGVPYQIWGDGASALGVAALDHCIEAWDFGTINVAAGGQNVWPAGTLRPTIAAHEANFDADYHLVPGSTYIGAASDGTDLGRRW